MDKEGNMITDWLEKDGDPKIELKVANELIDMLLEQNKKLYSGEDMLKASKYGYNFHKTTQFPNQEFEDSCIRNTQQWLEQFKNK
jgi:hypothetical protein